jgi:hypothetical protein
MSLELACVDLDGVAVDLTFGITDLLVARTSPDFATTLARLDTGEGWLEVFGMSITDIWNRIDAVGADWWANLPEIADRVPTAPRLSKLVDAVGRIADEVRILSALPMGDAHSDTIVNAAAGKLRWVHRRLGNSFGVVTCPRADKAMMSARNRVLIDDTRKNCVEWCRHGGGAVHYSPPATFTVKGLIRAVCAAMDDANIVRYS